MILCPKTEDVLWGENGKLRGKKKKLVANRASPDARDQAPSFDTPGDSSDKWSQSYSNIYLCFAKIGRRKISYGFGATEKTVR